MTHQYRFWGIGVLSLGRSMNHTRTNTVTSIVLLLLLAIVGCSKDDANNHPDYDRSSVLADQANNIIGPNFSVLATSCESLDNSINILIADPSLPHLEDARNALLDARTAFQKCTPSSSFGPSNSYALRNELNTFPSDSVLIEQNIASGQYVLGSISNLDAQGFPAIEYLLWSANNDADILNALTNDNNRRDYLTALSARCQEIASTVSDEWTAYSTMYIQQDGTDVGSSLGMVVNSLNLDFEKFIRDGKVGIPLGIRSLGNPLPGHVEAPYSGNSKALLTAGLEGLLQLIEGNEGSSYSLSTYMNHVGAQHSGTELSGVIRSHINDLINQVDAIDRPLEAWLVEEAGAADQLYTDLQQLVVYLKVDMTSSLGILISYQDTDGD